MTISFSLFLLLSFITLNVYCSTTSLIPNNFQVIGPFPIGEREEGVDTLEYYGGIFDIPIGDNTMYPCELGVNGVVGWQSYNAITTASSTSLTLNFSSTINWDSFTTPLSWSVYMWYAYAVGEFTVPSSSSSSSSSSSNLYLFDCTGLIRYYIRSTTNNTYTELIGDFFNYGVGQQLIELEPDTYQLILRVQSSVRQNLSPQQSFTCTITQQQQTSSQLIIVEKENMVPSILDGKLGGYYGSITLMNVGVETIDEITLQTGDNSVEGVSVELVTPSSIAYTSKTGVYILPGQKYGITFTINQTSDVQCPASLNITVNGEVSTLISFNCTTWGNPWSFTFIDFDETVQYAVAYPPSGSERGCFGGQESCVAMLATHGAGVSVIDTPGWYTAYPALANTWIIFPSGRRPWGYDWQTASRVDAFQSLYQFAKHMPGVPPSLVESLSIDVSRILFTGHSMGAYGCWTMLGHYGDMALGGACGAGFAKLQDYVYYNTRPSFSHLDPSLRGLLMSSIADADADIHASNMVGIPIIARYGGADTIVSPWHSRRMARMVNELSGNLSAVQISEVPGMSHWFTGMFDAPVMDDFYIASTTSPTFPDIPQTITITVMNPGISGSRANIQILQKHNTERVARIKLVQSRSNTNGGSLTWTLTTQNVKRFGLVQTPVRPTQKMPSQLMIDGNIIQTPEYLPEVHYHNTGKNSGLQQQWSIESGSDWTLTERSASTYGPIKQILQEKPFVIVYGTLNDQQSSDMLSVSIWMANYYNIYGRGSPIIISDAEYQHQSCNISNANDSSFNYNLILVGTPSQNAVTQKLEPQLTVSFGSSTNTFTIGDDTFDGSQPGTGITFLSPNECGNGLILVVAGTIDSQGLYNAIHSLPMRSGETVPDYLVVSNQWNQNGLGSTITTGFFNSHWNVSSSSSYVAL
ncbi:hypothetical protein DFA_01580 [Cavenderia fasciculata]|uniref:Peptidase S9 prolyl oligopeptidase catalytic domain-containing protein n=1 Tax=Cavenderia fasciculata TaxID=261658 RepID=F4PTM4_CACFS|nr:uncharacterized protein DFA_01580 [Cavenderia fasciculata]EGG21694.1 hypothetical protein DFA_01580 [Cavenderia fasciculata]|eukprot:XP_004359544.1 hypothetical protein DFA_01580 [Cavenderia fasciculata]